MRTICAWANGDYSVRRGDHLYFTHGTRLAEARGVRSKVISATNSRCAGAAAPEKPEPEDPEHAGFLSCRLKMAHISGTTESKQGANTSEHAQTQANTSEHTRTHADLVELG